MILGDDCDTMSFGYNFVEVNTLDKSQYEEEVTMIVKEQVEKALRYQVAEAERKINTWILNQPYYQPSCTMKSMHEK